MQTLPVFLKAKWKWLGVDGDGRTSLFSKRPKYKHPENAFGTRQYWTWGGDMFTLPTAPPRTKRVLYKRLTEGWAKVESYDKKGNLL